MTAHRAIELVAQQGDRTVPPLTWRLLDRPQHQAKALAARFLLKLESAVSSTPNASGEIISVTRYVCFRTEQVATEE